ncbi:MAG TPA: MG2 domain-containing protein, partial [Bacteroidales bacterium]
MKPQDNKDYSNEWKQVDTLAQQGLPRSAIQVVDKIFNEAKAEANEPQYIKALIYRASLQGQYQEDHLVGAINSFQVELATAAGVEKQIIQSLLAELYYRYYTQNRWLINSRTAVEGIENEDIHTWDAVKLNKTITELYLASMSDQEALEAVPLPDFSAILINTQKSGFTLWPSLYDLLANRALDYFSSSDAGLADVGGKFNIPAAQLFSPINEFVNIELPAADSLSYQYQAMRIYQQLLAFHSTIKNSTSLVDLDLKRLDFVRNQVISNETNDSLYAVALENLYNKYENDSVYVRIAFRLASQYQSFGYKYEPLKGDENRWWLNKAEEICEKAIQSFPNANETAACRNLLNTIREADFGFQINSAGLPDKPILAYLNFRNTTKVYFKIIKIDPQQDMEKRVNQNESDVVKSYLNSFAFKEFSQELPDTRDHQMHATEIILPALPLGYYVVFASSEAGFSNESDLEYNSIWVTELSYLTNNNKQSGSLEIFVLDRESGNAVSEVNITTYERKYDSRVRSYLINKLGIYVTDAEGYTSVDNLTDQTRNSLTLVLEKNGDRLNSAGYMNVYKSNKSNHTTTQTYFFTDRAIYRPGQTVYYKGIVVDKTGDEVAIKPGFSTTVSFYDANRKEIAKM